MLSEKFSIVTVLGNLIPLFREHVRGQGITENLASIRAIDIPVPDLADDSKREELILKLLDECQKAVDEDGAEAIVLGCTGMIDIAKEVSGLLSDYYSKPVPVIDPNGAAIGYLELLIRNKLTHSKITYPKPPEEAELAKKFAIAASKIQNTPLQPLMQRVF
jgi:Asp/Glu/hydantoin racemase